METLSDKVAAVIRDVPDFPKPGILFKDITPILADAVLMRAITRYFSERLATENVDVVVGMESRGFLFGVPLALELGIPFAPARKPGKLPYESLGVDYELEYGTSRLEMHVDAVQSGQRVVVIDDLLATGGTAAATCDLVRKLGGEVVACAFVIELGFLQGRNQLGNTPIESLLVY